MVELSGQMREESGVKELSHSPLEEFQVASSYDEIYEFCLDQGWTDGLPVVPPTPERLRAMLAWTDRAQDEVIASIPPLYGEASVLKIAVNAVMAGCRPEYLPVVLTAVDASADKSFNLEGLQTTTGPITPLVLVNGPIAQELGINGSTMAFGPGWRSNATIGRAVRLILMNIGGAKPGGMSHATQGQPGMFSLCSAENEARTPWQPFHVEHGVPPEESTVSVFAVLPGHDLYEGRTPEDVLISISREIGAVTHKLINGGENLLALCPEHAEILAAGGFSKRQVREYLWKHAGSPLSRLTPSNQRLARARRERVLGEASERDPWLPIADGPEQIHIVVIGGDSVHSTYYDCFSQSHCVLKRITNRQGQALRSVSDLRRG